MKGTLLTHPNSTFHDQNSRCKQKETEVLGAKVHFIFDGDRDWLV